MKEVIRRLVLEEKCTWDSQYVYDNMHPGTKQHQSSRSMTAVLESRRVQLDAVGCACRVTSELVVTRLVASSEKLEPLEGTGVQRGLKGRLCAQATGRCFSGCSSAMDLEKQGKDSHIFVGM